MCPPLRQLAGKNPGSPGGQVAFNRPLTTSMTPNPGD